MLAGDKFKMAERGGKDYKRHTCVSSLVNISVQSGHQPSRDPPKFTSRTIIWESLLGVSKDSVHKTPLTYIDATEQRAGCFWKHLNIHHYILCYHRWYLSTSEADDTRRRSGERSAHDSRHCYVSVLTSSGTAPAAVPRNGLATRVMRQFLETRLPADNPLLTSPTTDC